MKKLKFLGIICLIGFSLELFAQHQGGGGEGRQMSEIGVLSGTVYDSDGIAVEYATVSLFSLRDNKLITGGITDEKGHFKIEKIKLGAYAVHIKFIGFNTKVIKPVYIAPKGRGKGQGIEQNLGKIILEASSIEVDDVNVVADKAHVQYKIDKKVVNVSQDMNSAAGSAVDILENTPSIDVDIDGNVSLRGSGNFTVLIDGKPTVLDASDVLQQIPANSIENIEIITNPSAKYDPDGAAGIINVIMKKKKYAGFNGIINLSAGTQDRYKGDILLNYKAGKFSFTAGMDYRDEKRYGSGYQERITYYPDTTFFMNYSGERNVDIYGLGFRGGVDYYINDNNTISLSGRYGDREFQRIAESYYHEWSKPFNVEDYYLRDNTFGYLGTAYNIDLTYTLKLKKPNQKFETLLFYSKWDGLRFDDQNKYITDNDDNIIDNNPEKRKADVISPRESYRYQFDYTSPVGVNGMLEAGWQGRLDYTNSDYVYSYDSLGTWIIDTVLSNSLKYDRNIQAIYGTYANSIGGFDYKLGLRMEYTDRLIDQYTTGDKFPVNRFDYFPSAYITRELNKKQQIQLSYSRRINRPRGRNLNPFPNYSDPYNIQVGNPALEPEYVDSYELNYQKSFKKSFVSVEAFYRRTNNIFTRIRVLGDDNILYTTYDNLNHDNSLGMEFVANLNLLKWWRLNGSLSSYYYSILGEIDGDNISEESFNWRFRLNNTFSFKTNTRIQLTGFYTAPSATAQGTRDAFYFASIAVRQDLLNKKLSITAQLKDIFNTFGHRFTSESDDFYVRTDFVRQGQVFMLSLTYRINNYKDKKNRKGVNGDDFEGMDME